MLAGRFLMASLLYPDSLCYVKARMTIERQTVRELRDKLRQVSGSSRRARPLAGGAHGGRDAGVGGGVRAKTVRERGASHSALQ